MPRLGSTITRLVEGQRNWTERVGLAAGAPATGDRAGGAIPLTPVTGFGSDPGDLEMFTYVPERLAPDPALVVVLHGCTQTAAGYNAGSGWSALADRHGFVLVFPQQRAANNPKLCFDWFQRGDIGRDHGEALSIRQMVERAVVDHGVDRRRIFVTGLSAGGAMTAVMLATYPDVFAGGAVIAGLPYGTAGNVQEALQSMFQGRRHAPAEWGDLIRAASPHGGAWPTLSIWHGGADSVVTPGNAVELAKQWADLHGLAAEPSRRDMVDGQSRQVWSDTSGRDVIESITIAGMGHGTPLAVGVGDEQGGAAGPFMLDVGISSSHHIARFWGLTDAVVAADRVVAAEDRPEAARVAPSVPAVGEPVRPAARPVWTAVPNTAVPRTPTPKTALPGGIDVGATIRDALRSAGLLKG